MKIVTFLAYGITLISVFFSITSIPQIIIGGFVGRITGQALLSMLFGGIVSWFIISWLWKTIEGGIIPFAVLAGAFLVLGAHSTFQQDELTAESHTMIGAEQWAIVIVGALIMTQSKMIRWY